MKSVIRNIFTALVFFIAISSFSYCEAIEVEDLVDQYRNSTSLQQQELVAQHLYETLSLSGTVENVEEWDSFDERTDVRIPYYRIVAEPRSTAKKNLYKIFIFYKDADKIKDLNEDQAIQTTGSLLKIVDELDTLDLWFYGGQLTDEDKFVFQ